MHGDLFVELQVGRTRGANPHPVDLNGSPRWMDESLNNSDFIQLLRSHGGPYLWMDG